MFGFSIQKADNVVQFDLRSSALCMFWAQVFQKSLAIPFYLDSENLLPEILEVIESGLRGDGVDEDEALAILHVQVAHRCELFLKNGKKY
jgi:hypothetical protein